MTDKGENKKAKRFYTNSINNAKRLTVQTANIAIRLQNESQEIHKPLGIT